MTRQKTEAIIVTVCSVLATLIAKYELSGNDGGQRSEANKNHWKVHFSLCVNGYNRTNYLAKDSATFVL